LNDRKTNEGGLIPRLSRGEIYYHLRSRLPRDFDSLLARSRESRPRAEAERVIAGGVITLSTICVRNCLYCGFRAQESDRMRFRLSRGEVMSAGELAARSGLQWLILKAGEDPGLSPELVSELVRELRARFDLHITLSLGERPGSALANWKNAGIRSYLLRHETCDPNLYHQIRPSMFWVDRLHTLALIKEQGLELATGLLLGAPNQSSEGLVEDLLLFLDSAIFCALIEPFAPPPGSPGAELISRPENRILQPDIIMEKVIAIARILRPELLIPLDNAHFRSFNPLGDGTLFRAGANGLIFDFTPVAFSALDAQTPFVGVPISKPEEINRFRAGLQELGLKLEFTPPVK